MERIFCKAIDKLNVYESFALVSSLSKDAKIFLAHLHKSSARRSSFPSDMGGHQK